MGRKRIAGWGGRPKEEKAKVDAEIIRRCKEQAVKTPGRPPWGFYRRVAEEVYKTTPCCGPDLNQTMEAMEYTPFVPNYVNILCVGSGIFGKQESVADAVADPVNIKKVEAAIVKITSSPPSMASAVNGSHPSRRQSSSDNGRNGPQTRDCRAHSGKPGLCNKDNTNDRTQSDYPASP